MGKSDARDKMLSRALLLTDLCESIGFILSYSLNLSIHYHC